MATTAPRLRITGKVHQGRPGFLVSGRDLRHRTVSIWAPTREAAERIKAKVAAGHEITQEDFR
jgi:hypothetical protein